jgi:dTDP-4-dehydrorhamnose 3,5-epimerase
MKIESLAIDGLLLIQYRQIQDARGSLCEVFRADLFEEAAGAVVFVQENHSVSAARGTVRGLHFQGRPRAQGKLIRVLRGAVLDVAVDVRPGSLTFGQHVAVEMAASDQRQLWIPPGFLHGFCTLTDEVEVAYRMTDYYSPPHNWRVRWNDPDLAISWPVGEAEALLSDADRTAPLLRDAKAELALA